MCFPSNNRNNKTFLTMRQDLSWDSRMMTTPSGAELPPSIQPHASHQCRELTSNSHGQRQLLPFLTCVLILISPVSCTDLVYVRSNSYGQLITSSTMRWVRDHGGLSGPKETAVTLGGASSQTICRVNHLGLKDVGLLSDDESSCNVNPHDDSNTVTSSSKFQTLAGTAARLVWIHWTTPNPPPTGAVAVSEKPIRFLATNVNHSMAGYMDPSGNGVIVFPKEPQSEIVLEGLVLTEIEPERYELYDVELKKDRRFKETEIILSQGHLAYEIPKSEYEREDFPDVHPNEQLHDSLESESELESTTDQSIQPDEPVKGKIESVLTYGTDEFDYWGNGHLMVKGLPALINLPREWTPKSKSIEWGLPSTRTRRGETVIASADLWIGTAVNMTLKGTKLDGEATYWATLKTYYKDGSTTTRYVEGIRKLIQITNIRLEYGRPYFIANGTAVPEPTTTTTSTTTTTTSTTSKSTSSSTSPKSSESRTVNGNEQMFGDQHSTETLTFSASSKQSGATQRQLANLLTITSFILFLSLM